jgi:hypothetical protein
MSFNLQGEDIYNFIVKDGLMNKAMGGIYPSDETPPVIFLNNFYIINTHPARLPGEHWVCAYFPNSSPPEFFDSYGNKPTFYTRGDISVFMGEKYLFNSMKLQPSYSATCGLYCLYFLYHRVRGISYKDIINVFSIDVDYNDSIVINFYKKFYID